MSYRVLVEVIVEHALDKGEARRMVEGPLCRVLEFSSVETVNVEEVEEQVAA